MLTTIFYSLFALDRTVAELAAQNGHWLYLILFLVIFAETGLVVFPFLPGDSILFIAGTVVATADLNVHLLVAALIAAAILGDSVNYSVGHYIGPRAFDRPDTVTKGQSQVGEEKTLSPVMRYPQSRAPSEARNASTVPRFPAA
jgi:membrane-associated protein